MGLSADDWLPLQQPDEGWTWVSSQMQLPALPWTSTCCPPLPRVLTWVPEAALGLFR